RPPVGRAPSRPTGGSLICRDGLHRSVEHDCEARRAHASLRNGGKNPTPAAQSPAARDFAEKTGRNSMIVDRAWVERNIGFDPIKTTAPAASYAFAPAAKSNASLDDIQRD